MLATTYLLWCLMVGQPDTTSVKLERAGGYCIGTCPAYSVEVFASGKVLFEGKEGVGVTGKREYSIPEDSALVLFKFVEEMDFFSLKREYMYVEHFHTRQDGTIDTLIEVASDASTQYVTVRVGNRAKTIEDYFGAPSKLGELETLIDRIAQTATLVRQGE